VGKTLTYDHCKRHPEWQVNVSGLVEYNDFDIILFRFILLASPTPSFPRPSV